jgi:hypothetical protein
VLYWVVCDTATKPPLVVVVSLLRDQKLVLRKTEIIILILGTWLTLVTMTATTTTMREEEMTMCRGCLVKLQKIHWWYNFWMCVRILCRMGWNETIESVGHAAIGISVGTVFGESADKKCRQKTRNNAMNSVMMYFGWFNGPTSFVNIKPENCWGTTSIMATAYHGPTRTEIAQSADALY